jgi:hypothetical protein
MTLNHRKYTEGTNGYRPGALNVQVNGIQIEDLYQEWAARGRECEELRAKNERMKAQLIEQGKVIAGLKENKNEAKWLSFTRPEQAWVMACSHCDYTVATCTPYCPNCGAKMKGDND